MIDELMQWTQQRLGRTRTNPSICNLAYMVNETKDLLVDALELKDLTCEMNVDEMINVMADGAIVKTILRNLLANAIKYSSENDQIGITAKIKDSQVIISITDKGQGVSADVLTTLFKESVESQNDTEGLKGSGIGLSLCAELIETQKGKIWVDESYIQGARIQFSLPLALQA